ncbi:Lsr2 protein [Micromonospora sp. Llam0]|uniref:histone-like nucleoid-structuring protein Lsr2 n=1 Tax=Micromonospora sp. Llam0 TaxID=2485143 RepID=UPI000F47213F|nr:Lsr2 family protein [Micromonospora sp. Llam0]ROO52848.1 Lsr2 protein [Micromonospora sp. Llam0]
MATRTTSVVYDDFDGSTDDIGTYRFAFNGVLYEIDLSRPNFDRMAAAFQPFITAARRLPKSTVRKQTRHDTNTDRRALNARIRQWWATHRQKHNLPEPRTRGAIPPAVRDAYNSAH